MEIGPEHLRAACALSPFDDEAARALLMHAHRHDYPEPPRYRDGAVLVAFRPADGGPVLLLTRRTDRGDPHGGQISFPGGAREDGEGLLEAALREAREEVGLPREAVRVLGTLAPLRIPVSAFVVHPFVAFLAGRPDYSLDPREVESVLEVPLPLLLDPARRTEKVIPVGPVRRRVPIFDVPGAGDPPLWGATAMILSGLLERLRAVLHSTRSGIAGAAPSASPP
jgi:8-oxo-dGTP pyrophosphatase MutT (NUDIX family)